MKYEKAIVQNSSDLNPEKPIFPIGFIAEMLKVHQRTLRIYDTEGILSPSRSGKNRRLYSLNDIEKGRFIQYLTRSLGINIIGVKVIFHMLSELQVPVGSYNDYIQKVTETLNITTEMQEANIAKYSRRGRKKKELLAV